MCRWEVRNVMLLPEDVRAAVLERRRHRERVRAQVLTAYTHAAATGDPADLVRTCQGQRERVGTKT
jgi:hypothetical protein